MMMWSTPSTLISVPAYLAKSTTSPTFTSILTSFPLAGATGHDFALGGLFLRGIGDEQTAGGLFFGLKAFHEYTVIQGFHNPYPPKRFLSVSPGAVRNHGFSRICAGKLPLKRKTSNGDEA